MTAPRHTLTIRVDEAMRARLHEFAQRAGHASVNAAAIALWDEALTEREAALRTPA